MNIVLIALLTACAVMVLLARPAEAARARLLTVSQRRQDVRDKRAQEGRPAHRLASLVAGVGLFVLLGGVVGVCAGALSAMLLSRWLAGLEPRAARLRRQRIEADLPIAADLLAACLLAGSPPAEAAAAVATALGGPLGEELQAVVATVRLGGDPVASWLRLAREPVLAPLARSWARTLETGAPLAEAMTRLADEQRSARRWAAEAGARRAGVRATAPLGLCFLPAFVLIGVVPAVVGVADGLLR